MMTKRILLLLSALVLLASCVKENPSIQMDRPSPLLEPQIESIVVKLEPEMHKVLGEAFDAGVLKTKSGAINDFVEKYGICSVERVFGEDPEYAERERAFGLNRWYRLRYDASKAPSTKAAENLLYIEGVEIAEREHKIKVAAEDKYFSNQWALYQKSGIDINVKPVWEKYSPGDSKVIVAVIDNGVDPNHEDLKGVVDPSLSKNFFKGGTITGCRHGTHVGGTIAAIRNNGKGVAGIAGGDAEKGISAVTIMSCQVGDDKYFSVDPDAFRYAANKGALIAQNSWGYDYDWNDDGQITGEELTAALAATIGSADKAGVDYFIKYAGCDNSGNQKAGSLMKGGIVTFAAGNEDIANGAPANYDKIIAVGAIDKNGKRSYFSNYGPWVDICAPGEDIYNTVPNSQYDYMNGTSMACPHVSGVAALVISQRGGPGFTNEMLWDCLIDGAKKINTGSSSKPIGPLVDAYGAVTYGMASKPGDLSNLNLSVNSNSATLTCKVPNDGENGVAYAVSIFVSKDRSKLESLNMRNPATGVSAFYEIIGDKSLGDDTQVVADGLEFETNYYYVAAAMNYGSVFGNPSQIGSFKTLKNNPPVIEPEKDITNWEIKATKKEIVKFNVSDPDGHTLNVTFTSGSNADSFIQGVDGLWNLIVDATAVEAGNYSATIVATDPYGLSTSLIVNYTVLPNRAPEISKTFEGALLNIGESSREFDLNTFFSDPDEDQLTYVLENPNVKIANAMVNGTTLFITPKSEGTFTLTIIAKDYKEASVSQDVKVIVRKKGENVSLSPLQVIDNLNVETGASLALTTIKIYSMSGNLVIEKNIESSAFRPAVIDMTGVAPGQYIVEVTCDGKVDKKMVVKL